MRRQLLNLLFGLSLAGVSNAQEAAPQQLGDLFITLTSATAPPVLATGQERLVPPSDRYWVVAEVTFQNIGNLAICASFSTALRAEQGLTGRAGAPSGFVLSDLQPGDEAKTRYVFTLPRGTKPLELILRTADYGRDCGDKLPPDAASSVKFPIDGVSSPPAPAASRVPPRSFTPQTPFSVKAAKAESCPPGCEAHLSARHTVLRATQASGAETRCQNPAPAEGLPHPPYA